MQISDKHAFFISDNKRMNVDIFVPLNKMMGATNGEKVVVKMTSWGENQKNPNGEVIKVLGQVGNNDVEIHSILEEYNLPYEFTQKVINESELISEVITEKEINKRLDMRDILTFTIDGETAKDLDDALSVEWVDGKIKVGVHIADVSYYVKPNTAIDDEAYKRGTSVYLVDRVVPMLPEKLSNNLCSLNPHTDKLVYSFIFTLDNNGKVIDEQFCRGIINSNYRLT
jgi:ribonuclease R